MALSTQFVAAKNMQAAVNAAYRIRDIARDFGAKLPADFKLNNLFDLPIELIQKIVVKLMEKECTSLRREVVEMNVLMLPALQLYLAMRPRKVDLTAFLSYCPKRLKYEYLKATVICISEKAADIEELFLLVAPEIKLRMIYGTADDELLQALGKLRRLRVLRIEEICNVHLIDLIGLCQNLPNLEYLEFNIHDDVAQLDFKELNIAEKLKSAMPKLQVFLFELEDRENAHILLKCCTENLPNLRVIQSFSSRFGSFEDYESPSQTITCASGSSNLRHLKVDYVHVESCSHLPTAYPLITHLRILWKPHANDAEEKNLAALLQLTHLESLNFIDVPQEIFHLFVEKFGPNLRGISIYYNHVDYQLMAEFVALTNCTLGQLLALCPKLERLGFVETFKEDLEPIAFFSNLKEIKMELFGLNENKKNRLTDILRAPNLETLTLNGRCIDFEELRRVSTLIREKKILGKLRNLHFGAYYVSVIHFQEQTAYFKEIAAFIKCVAASLPTIRVITFDLHHSRTGYAALARTLSNGKTTNDEIDGINEFFGNQFISSDFVEFFVDEELIAILEDYRR